MYYSAYDVTTRVSFATLVSVHDSGHSGVDRTFAGRAFPESCTDNHCWIGCSTHMMAIMTV